MSDTLESYFLTKLNNLDKILVNKNNNREVALIELRKIKSWLTGNRSLKQHRTLQAYFTHLYLSHGQVEYIKQTFVEEIKKNIGYVKYDDSEIKFNENGEEKVIICREKKVQSLSFSDCSQTLHAEIFEKVKIYAWYEYQDDFDAWFNHWYDNENTLQ